MRSILAGDLGGTKCRFALVSERCEVVAAERIDTVRDQPAFLLAMEQCLGRVLAARPASLQPPVAFGVGTAGVIPAGGRSIARAPNLPLDGFALAAHFEQRLRLPTTVINDGRASALGESLTGTARGRDPLLCLFFGTGIGIGMVVDGKPYGGADNAAGEIGHTIHLPGGRICACGGAGHFEAYCGGRAITERALAEIGPPPGQAWRVGDVVRSTAPAARAILRDAEVAAAILTANACTLLNPRAVVLGGGVLAGWPQLRSAIEQFVRAQCSPSIQERLEFHASQGGSDAILVGAAAATMALPLAAG